jgi:hypothetical protein
VSPVELAAAAGTVDYELLTRLGPRYRRRYIGAGGSEDAAENAAENAT